MLRSLRISRMSFFMPIASHVDWLTQATRIAHADQKAEEKDRAANVNARYARRVSLSERVDRALAFGFVCRDGRFLIQHVAELVHAVQ